MSSPVIIERNHWGPNRYYRINFVAVTISVLLASRYYIPLVCHLSNVATLLSIHSCCFNSYRKCSIPCIILYVHVNTIAKILLLLFFACFFANVVQLYSSYDLQLHRNSAYFQAKSIYE